MMRKFPVSFTPSLSEYMTVPVVVVVKVICTMMVCSCALIPCVSRLVAIVNVPVFSPVLTCS